MKCEICGNEGAIFTGSSKPWGPDPSDANNTPENLPGGHAWLCPACLDEMSPFQTIQRSFYEWMKEVDRIIALNLYGNTSEDILSQPYRDWYMDGVSAVQAARKAIRANEF